MGLPALHHLSLSHTRTHTRRWAEVLGNASQYLQRSEGKRVISGVSTPSWSQSRGVGGWWTMGRGEGLLVASLWVSSLLPVGRKRRSRKGKKTITGNVFTIKIMQKTSMWWWALSWYFVSLLLWATNTLSVQPTFDLPDQTTTDKSVKHTALILGATDVQVLESFFRWWRV